AGRAAPAPRGGGSPRAGGGGGGGGRRGGPPPPLSLTPFGAVGTAAWVRVGRGRSLSRARRGRCLAVGADCGRSDGSSRNELRPRMALGATLARPTFTARLARMPVATDRPPHPDGL